jgi:hypothetical protein
LLHLLLHRPRPARRRLPRSVDRSCPRRQRSDPPPEAGEARRPAPPSRLLGSPCGGVCPRFSKMPAAVPLRPADRGSLRGQQVRPEASTLAREGHPDPMRLPDRGDHRLKALRRPARIFALVRPRLAAGASIWSTYQRSPTGPASRRITAARAARPSSSKAAARQPRQPGITPIQRAAAPRFERPAPGPCRPHRFRRRVKPGGRGVSRRPLEAAGPRRAVAAGRACRPPPTAP